MHKGDIWKFLGEKFSTIVENLLKTIGKGLKNVENFEKRGTVWDSLGQIAQSYQQSFNKFSTVPGFAFCLFRAGKIRVFNFSTALIIIIYIYLFLLLGYREFSTVCMPPPSVLYLICVVTGADFLHNRGRLS